MSSLAAASSSSSSSILLHAFLLLVAAMVAAAASDEHRRDVKMSNAAASVGEVSPPVEIYYCFLCAGRSPMLIHVCPIYWDECYLNCWDADHEALPSSSQGQGQGQGNDECYVMKLYMSGRYVIVQRLSCQDVASCFLTCGGGELPGDRNVTRTTMPATIQGSILPAAEQLCDTWPQPQPQPQPQQLNALSAPPSAAGGAH